MTCKISFLLLRKIFIFIAPAILLPALTLAESPERKLPTEGSLAYILQAEKLSKKRPEALAALADCDRDVLVIDASFYGDDESRWTPKEIASLRLDNPHRVILCYFSIGEAEDYRAYWEKTWKKNPPSWMLGENPDWEGNFRVKYWDTGWQKIILSELDKILPVGFDGIYLDIVDAYEGFEHNPETDEWLDDRPNPITGKTYREDMISWVQKLAKHARDVSPSYLVVPQNASQLLKDRDYAESIDAVGIEDLFSDGKKMQKTSEIDYRSQPLDVFHAATGKPVFLIDYTTKDPALQEEILDKAKKHGFNLLITKRNLGELGFCPPKK